MKKVLIFLITLFFYSCSEKPVENELFNRLSFSLFEKLDKVNITRELPPSGNAPKFEKSIENGRIKLIVHPILTYFPGSHYETIVQFQYADLISLNSIKRLEFEFEYSFNTSREGYELVEETFTGMDPRVFFKEENSDEWEIVANLNDLDQFTERKRRYLIKIEVGFKSGNMHVNSDGNNDFRYNETTYFINTLNLKAIL